MSYQGHIEKGVVVFDEPVSLPDGTTVRIEEVSITPNDFWHPLQLAELVRRQNSALPAQLQNVAGGWPLDELDDGFEDAAVEWRAQELEHRG